MEAPVLSIALLRDNWAISGSPEIGGGVCTFKSAAEFVNCTFIGNIATRGGGMFNQSSALLLKYCTFVGNSGSQGGGVCNSESNSNLFSCRFIGNRSPFSARPGSSGGVAIFRGQGAGVANVYSDPTLAQCVFAGNRANWESGAVYSDHSSKPTLTNCTFVGNSASQGKALAFHNGGAQLLNCIVWNGSQAIWEEDCPPTIVSYSNVQGGWVGPGNIDADPCFANLGYWDPNGATQDVNDDFWVDGDYHLKSQAGRWEPTRRTWVIDDVTSACIDAGNPMSPVGLEPFPNGGRVNMGAYGGTVEASKSYFGKTPCETISGGDINGDCSVDLEDFGIMARHWLEDIG